MITIPVDETRCFLEHRSVYHMKLDRRQNIQMDTRFKPRIEIRNQCLSPIDFFVLYSLPYGSAYNRRDTSFMVYGNHDHMMVSPYRKNSIGDRNMIMKFWSPIEFLYSIDFQNEALRVDEPSSFLVYCEYFHMVGIQRKTFNPTQNVE